MTSALAINQPISDNYNLLKTYPRDSIFRLYDTISDKYIEVDYDYMLTNQNDYEQLVGVQLPSRYTILNKTQIENLLSKDDFSKFNRLTDSYPSDYQYLAIELNDREYEITIDSTINLSFVAIINDFCLY